MSLAIRPATPADAAAINDLRNFYVRTSTAIYSELGTSLGDRRRWLTDRDATRHPVTVATLDGEFAGWASLSPAMQPADGYRFTAEDSVYVHPDHHRRGVGSALLGDLLDRGRAGGVHCVIARIDSEQTSSLHLHEKHGFAESGRLREAGYKFGRRLDVVFLQKLLSDEPRHDVA